MGFPCPLPALSHKDLESRALSAYNVCLSFEYDAKISDEAMYARVLGYLIIHAPSPAVRREVVKAIHSCNRDYRGLPELGEAFVDDFIWAFKTRNGCRTPDSSVNLSQNSVDKDQEYSLELLQDSPRYHKEAKRQVLIRDAFRCVVTGRYDNVALGMSSIDQEDIREAGSLYTVCAHIVPESTCPENNSSSPEKNYFASVAAVLNCFGYNIENMNGPKVHSLSNMMTMEYNVLDLFDRLQLWFEPTEIKHCYIIKIIRSYYKVPEKITLRSTDPLRLPLPSPDLLALHAYCAKVAYFSGAGAYVDVLEQDVDDLGYWHLMGGRPTF